MSVSIVRGNPDSGLEQVSSVLKGYEASHGASKIDLYRQNSVSIRVRIIDPDFQEQGKSLRHKSVWQFLEKLPEELQNDITMLVLLTPDEMSKSFANLEFEDPVPSQF